MSAIFNIVSIPFGYVMRFIYDLVGNYGLAIILFTILCKIILLPMTIKQKKSTMALQALQPKLLAVQKKWSADRERMAAETQKVYDDAGVSPMGGCGTTLLTFPIMIGLYYVIVRPLTYLMHLSADQLTALSTALGVEASANVASELSLAGLINQNFAAASGRIQDPSSSVNTRCATSLSRAAARVSASVPPASRIASRSTRDRKRCMAVPRAAPSASFAGRMKAGVPAAW
jgi:YidC/Oxa1 family membrane protein insertase